MNNARVLYSGSILGCHTLDSRPSLLEEAYSPICVVLLWSLFTVHLRTCSKKTVLTSITPFDPSLSSFCIFCLLFVYRFCLPLVAEPLKRVFSKVFTRLTRLFSLYCKDFKVVSVSLSRWASNSLREFTFNGLRDTSRVSKSSFLFWCLPLEYLPLPSIAKASSDPEQAKDSFLSLWTPSSL